MRPIRDDSHSVDVRWFGTDPTGVANGLAVINAAIARVVANGGGTGYFPPGRYLTTSTIMVTLRRSPDE